MFTIQYIKYLYFCTSSFTIVHTFDIDVKLNACANCFTVENTDFPNMRLCGKIFVVCPLEVFNSEKIQGIFTCFRRVLTVSNRVQFVEHSIGTDVIESIYLQNIYAAYMYNVRIRYLFTCTRKLNIGKY